MKLILGLLLLCLVISVIAASTAQGDESIQSAVQPMHCLDIWADSIAVGSANAVTVIPSRVAAGVTLYCSQPCSLLAYSPSACVDDSNYQHFDKDWAFEVPTIWTDSIRVVNKGAATGFFEFWFWGR